MNTQTIVVSNRKGGVGKTTIAVHLAAGLAQLGYRTLLIDTDSQGHAGLVLGVPKAPGLYNLMCDDEARISDWLRMPRVETYAQNPNTDPNLIVLPSDKMTVRIPLDQSSPFRFRSMIRSISRLMRDNNMPLDFVIVDTNPTSSMFDGSIILAADWLIYPTQCSYLSFDGLTEVMAELNQITEDIDEYRDNPVQIAGIVPNMIRTTTNNHIENLTQLIDQFGSKLVIHPLPLATDYETAFEYQQTIFSFRPDSNLSIAAWRMVAEIAMRIGIQPNMQTAQLIEQAIS